MKSTTITILATVGVLALASVAMVVNADTLSSIGTGAIGGASEVLIPASTDTAVTAVPATAAPTPSALPTPAGNAPTETAAPSSSDDDGSHDRGVSEHDEDGDDD